MTFSDSLSATVATKRDEGARRRSAQQLELGNFGETFSRFRAIHYLGSKLRLVDRIREVVAEVRASSDPVCDLFSGSGTVSVALARDAAMVAVDIQEYSRVLCSALLKAPRDRQAGVHAALRSASRSEHAARLAGAVAPLVELEDHLLSEAQSGTPEGLCDLVECGSLAGVGKRLDQIRPRALRTALQASLGGLERGGLGLNSASLMTRHFGGLYFSFRQAVALDALLEVIRKLPRPLRDFYLAVTLSTASEVVNTVGKQFAQPIRPRTAVGELKTHLVQQIIRDRTMDVHGRHEAWLERYSHVARSGRSNRVLRMDFAHFLATWNEPVSAVYADPPYTRDHYSRFYHVLETMCLQDEPELSTTMIRSGGQPQVSRGSYRKERHQSPFCIKSQAPGAFRQLLEGVRRLGVPLVLSYSPYQKDSRARPRLLGVAEIVEMAGQVFGQVRVEPVSRFFHSKLNLQARNTPPSGNSEVLVVCRP